MSRSIKYKNRIALLLSLAMIFAMGASGIYAGSQEAISHVDTGVVNISITEYMLDEDGEEIPWVDGVAVLPGTNVSKIPYFTATGNDCYIRAKVVIDGVKEDAVPLEDSNLKGIPDGWSKIGDYYYYGVPLKTHESVDFFHELIIPSEWNDLVNPSYIGDWGFSVKIIVDAIQADNFTPSFESDNPWGDVEIKESLYKDGYDVNKFTTTQETDMAIIISDYDNIIIEPEDFFEGLKTMVPGDVLTDSVKIDSKSHVKLYFTTESIEDVDLLQNIKLQIRLTKDDETTIIYDGVLDSQLKNKMLGEFKKGEAGELSFTIEMPATLDNEYTLRNGTVKWLFRADSINDGPQTGDESPLFLYIGMMVFSGLSILIIIFAPLFKTRKDCEK